MATETGIGMVGLGWMGQVHTREELEYFLNMPERPRRLRKLHSAFTLRLTAERDGSGTAGALPGRGSGGGSVNGDARITGAPVSWGVIEVPEWCYQMPADRVLREAAALGLAAMEAGPEGFLPQDPAEVSDVLAGYGLSLVGGFVPAVLHDALSREAELAFVERRAEFFAAAGAEVVVLAATTGSESYGRVAELDDGAWRGLFESLSAVEEICARHSLTLALHFKEAARLGVFRPLGDGDVAVEEVVGRLERSGYCSWHVLEQDTVVEAEPDEGKGPVSDVRKSPAYLQRQLEKIA
jgi:sugar phosphate isomerase/epimerase